MVLEILQPIVDGEVDGDGSATGMVEGLMLVLAVRRIRLDTVPYLSSGKTTL